MMPKSAFPKLTARTKRKPPRSVDDVVAAVDVQHAAGDQLGAVERQERGGVADVVDADEAARRRLGLRLVHELVEVRNARRRTGRERAGRDRVDADALRT